MFISSILLTYLKYKIILINWLKLIYHSEQRRLGRLIYHELTNWWFNNESSIETQAFYNKSLANILDFSKNKCAYYSDFKTKNELREFPVIEKHIIRENKSDFIASNIHEMKYFNMNTGGSTGEPLDFPINLAASYVDKAHQKFNNKIMGFERGDRIAGFAGLSIPNSLVKRGVYFVPTFTDYAHYMFSSLYLNDNTIKNYIRNFLTLKPTILRGYPSFIYTLAKYIIENNISIKFSIKGVLLTAEKAFNYQLDMIKHAFNTDVYLQYGHSEVAIFGFTKKNEDKYFCSPFYGSVEVLNSENKSVEKGQEGDIVVTGFHNYAMPFIRYKTGDRGILGDVEKNVVVLNQVLGRSQDYIFDLQNNKYSLTAVIFGQHFKSFKNIEKWQIVQSVKGEIEINIIKHENFSQEDEKEIISKFLENAHVKVKINYVDEIKLTKRGKQKFLIQYLDEEN